MQLTITAMPFEFHRIKRLPPYVFAEVNAMKAAARARGEDINDFGMGNPDTPPAPHIVDKLVETARDPKTHRYSTSRGIPGLRLANANYYRRRFGVDIDPEGETIVTLGSKEGLANLAQAITTPGMSSWRQIRAIPSTPTVSSSPGRKSGMYPRAPAGISWPISNAPWKPATSRRPRWF